MRASAAADHARGCGMLGVDGISGGVDGGTPIGSWPGGIWSG
jgi:hypothetical protein